MEYIKGENGYNELEIMAAKRALQIFTRTARVKSLHSTLLYWELKKLMENTMMPINRHLFDPTTYWQFVEYNRKINDGKVRKDKLDHALTYCLESLYNDLVKIQSECFK